jgi:hypothetical protein
LARVLIRAIAGETAATRGLCAILKGLCHGPTRNEAGVHFGALSRRRLKHLPTMWLW